VRQNLTMRDWLRNWLRTGDLLAAASIVLLIAMQAVAGQWFPPPISVSQYGIGPWGWIFSLWAVSVSVSPWCLERAFPQRGWRPAVSRGLLRVGVVGAFVMAAVRTQAGGAQATWNAKVHMVGSILALGCLPLGITAALWGLGRFWRRIGLIELTAVAVSLALLLYAAAGYDTAGMGAPRSWAFWQMVAVIVSTVLILTLSAATHDASTRHMSDHTSPEVIGSSPRS
jgi:hypothetical protein